MAKLIPVGTARALGWSIAGVVLALSLPAAMAASGAPQIRTSAKNVVPSCVTPERLMEFLRTRNKDLDPRFNDIAAQYKQHGDAWRVRWDYAFFQMAVETNFLTYKRGDGRWGDVRPRQNNFAGLGTTGGGVPGDSYPDVGTGVLAQIQHLVAYSGEHIDNPVGARTKLKQDDIIESMRQFGDRATFADLSRRWAVDRHYGAAIEWVAGNYRKAYCGKEELAAAAPAPNEARGAKDKDLPPAAALGGPAGEVQRPAASPVRTIWSRENPVPAPEADAAPASPAGLQLADDRAPSTPPKNNPDTPAPPKAPASPTAGATAQAALEDQPQLPAGPPTAAPAFAFAAAMDVDALTASPAPEPVASARRCRVLSASYGGKKTLLVLARADGEARYTALTVLDGFERSMLDNYLKAHAPGGASVGEFATREAALAKAKQLCPGVPAARQAQSAG